METSFHPDFHLLSRDLKTSTSAEATRVLLRQAQLSPFEARGQAGQRELERYFAG